MLVFNGSIPGPTIFADWGDDGKFEIKSHSAGRKRGAQG